MPLTPSPKTKRNIFRILPFGLIWLVTGWIFLFTEMAATGYKNLQPSSAITLTFPVFLFASVAVTFVGFLFGIIEMVFFQERFRNYSLSRKILLKLFVYLLFITIILLITYPIAASIELSIPFFHELVWQKMTRFFFSITFLSTFVQLAFSILLSLIYSAISENLGHQVLHNFFTGKYHKPVIEHRVFMFLDMKSSTSIAEKLGHKKYFNLLEKYYDCMSDPIINHFGEVYQYIGDEIVISWPLPQGIQENHCIRCFFAIRKSMEKQRGTFLKHFGVFPAFRAGAHMGAVTTGEIGALKKEIVFTGDVLNTTSRIQGFCKEYGQDLIISEILASQLSVKEEFLFTALGTAQLRGKTKALKLVGVERKPVS